MRRLALQLAVSALIGAAATVLVAWALALTPMTEGRPGRSLNSVHTSQYNAKCFHMVEETRSPGRCYVHSWPPVMDQHGTFLDDDARSLLPSAVPNWAIEHVRSHWSEYARHPLLIESFGWPCIAGYSVTTPFTSAAELAPHDLVIKRRPVRRPLYKSAYPAVLPLHVIWPGFSLNTALYGGLAFLAWTAPGFIRRRSRRRRGRCPRCGYDLGPLVTCPECGP